MSQHISRLEQQFLELWGKESNFDQPEREYKFHPDRRWRFDFAWPGLWTAVEMHGGTFTAGRHSRGIGQAADFEKFNEAARMGWVVLHFTGVHLKPEPTLTTHEKHVVGASWMIGLIEEVLSNQGKLENRLQTGPDRIWDAGSA